MVAKTTDTTAFNLDFAELAEEAYERAGSELRSGYDLRSARRSLNLMTIEWANKGINMWTIEQGSVPLVAGTATYDLPVDTIDLLEHFIRTGSSTNQLDINISRISVSTYSTIPNKNATGRPIQIFIQRRSGATNSTNTTVPPRFTVWPVPDPSTTYTLFYWRLRRIQDAGNGVNGQDIPFRFLPAMVSGLAYYIAMKIPGMEQRAIALKAVYEEQFQLAADEDREKAPVRFVPRQAFLR
jgi:hypothetical protein